MKRLSSFLFLLLFVVSCRQQDVLVWNFFRGHEPVPGVGQTAELSSDTFQMSYRFADEVIRFSDSEAERYILAVEEDETVVMDARVPSSLRPAAGSILSAGVTATTPFGLGNRVLSVEEVDGALYCRTEVASLDEVFSELELTAAVPLNPDDLVLLDEDGNPIQTGRAVITEEGEMVVASPDSKAGGSIGRPDLITIPIPAAKTGGYLSGDIGFGTVLVVEISRSSRTFEVSIESSMGFNASLGYRNEAELTKISNEDNPKRLRFLPKTTIVEGVVQLGPVTLRPYVDISGEIALKLKGDVHVDFGQGFSVKVGWNQDGPILTGHARDDHFFKEFVLDGRLCVEPSLSLDFGLGLWTKRVAAELKPTLSFEAGAELELTANENTWRLEPKAYAESHITVDGVLLIDIFKILHLTRELTFADWEIFHKDWPLLPKYEESSLSVEFVRGSTPPCFDASYTLTGGLLSQFGAVYPSLRVFRGGELIKVLDDDTRIAVNKLFSPSFLIDNMEHDVSYTAKPSVRIGSRYFDKDGIPFSSTTPTAAVTDIVQTSSDQGSFYFQGHYYAYIFEFYVSAYIKGSQFCDEWGIYDPEAVDEYNPSELVDGRITQYWTGWSDYSSATWTKTPYVILPGGEYKFYESHSHTCSYGGGGPVMNDAPARYGIPSSGFGSSLTDQQMVARLDSIVVGGRTIVFHD